MSCKGQLGTDQQVIRGILQYMLAHPNAKDTFDGILKWWRPKDKHGWRKDVVQEGLDFLISKGWLRVRNTSQSQKIYGFNTEAMEEIREFLNEVKRKL